MKEGFRTSQELLKAEQILARLLLKGAIMLPILTVPQIPRQFHRDHRSMKRRMFPIIGILGALIGGSAIGAFFYTPLWAYVILLGFMILVILFCYRIALLRSNTVEFYDGFLLLRNYRREIIREICYEKVLRADTVILRFSPPGRNADMNAKGLYICLWLAETPPIFEDDSFWELEKWDELFLLAHDENAEAFLREKIKLIPQRPT